MNISRIKAIMNKEFKHILRDPRTLAMTFILPVLMLMLYGFALTFDVKNIPIVIFDKDNSNYSRELIQKFVASGYFSVVGSVDSFKDQECFIMSSKAKAAITFDENFSKDILSNRKAELQVVVDGADSNTAVIAMGYISGILQDYSKEKLLKVSSVTLPIDARTNVWYNRELKSMNFLVPGLIVFILMILAAMIISMTIVNEKTRGTMEQLIVTSLRPIELMIGKMIPYAFIGIGDVLLCVFVGNSVFGVPIRGSFWLLLFESVLFILGAMGIGLMISVTAKRQEDAVIMGAMATMLPSLLLSGFMFPIASMPLVVQWLTLLIPARYFLEILRGIFLKGVGLEVLWGDTLLLFIFAVFMIIAASKRLRKKLD